MQNETIIPIKEIKNLTKYRVTLQRGKAGQRPRNARFSFIAFP